MLVTPHAAGYSDQVVDDLQRLAVEEIMAVFQGGLPSDLGWANRALMPDGGRIAAARRSAIADGSSLR